MRAVQRVGYVEVYGDVGVGTCQVLRKRGSWKHGEDVRWA